MDSFKLDKSDTPANSHYGEVSVPVSANAICAKCHAHLAVELEWVGKDWGEDGHIRVLVHPCNVCLAELLTKYKERYLADYFQKQANVYKKENNL